MHREARAAVSQIWPSYQAVTHQVHSAVVELMKSMTPWPKLGSRKAELQQQHSRNSQVSAWEELHCAQATLLPRACTRSFAISMPHNGGSPACKSALACTFAWAA